MCKKIFILMCVVVMVASSASLATIDDPVGWWKLDEGFGTTTADSSVNSNDGIFVSNPAWAPGQDGSSLLFDADGRVNISDNTTLNVTTAFTLSAWIKVDPDLDSLWSTAISKDDSFAMQVVRGDSDAVYFGINGTVDNGGLWFDTPICDGEWHHVAATYLASDMKLRGYIDGFLDGQESKNFGNVVVSATDLVLGGGWGDRPWTGCSIDDVRLYNRQLSAEEIAELAAIPEPAIMTMLGLAGLLIFRRGRA